MRSIARITVLCAALCAGLAAAQNPAGEIASLEGKAERREAGERNWRTAAVREKLFPSNFLRTLDMSRAVIKYQDGSGQQLGPNSEMQVLGGTPTGAANGVKLNRGKTWMQSNAPPRSLVIETPSALAAIRGTDWEVEVGPDGRTTVSVFSGEVELSNDLGSVRIAPGEQAEAERGKAPVKLTLLVSRERIQWVSSMRIDPARHPGEELPAAYERLRRLQAPTAAQAVLLADIELYRGEARAAREMLERAATRFPGDASIDVALARSALFAGDLEAAAVHARRAVGKAPQSADAHVMLGEVERRRGRARESLQAYAQAVALAANDPRGWHGLGAVEAERENVSRARSHLERAIALDARDAEHLGELGTLEGFAGNLTRARATLEQAIALQPDNYVALTGLGVVLLKAGDAEGALDALIKASTIEPRYARAHVYAAAAYYQLERENAALKMLARAAELDPNDPLPHLLRGIVHLDRIEPTQAVESARAALERIPFLKSLNQVADNQRGVANVGFPLAFMGLEAWARSAAHESYLPSWGASHLFLADRYPGEFNRRSELLQGFMANPLAFGGSNRFQSLFLAPGHFGTVSLRHNTSDDLRVTEPVVTLNGYRSAGVPFAYFVEAIDTDVRPRNTAFDLRGQTYTAAVGVKPVHELGLFAYVNHLRADAQLGRAGVTGEVARIKGDASRIDAGAHYAPDSASSWWLKAGASRQDSRLDQLGSILLPQQELFRDSRFETRPEQQDIGLRHIMALRDRLELAWGAEAARAENPRNLLRDAAFHFAGTPAAKELLDQRDVDRSKSLHVSARYSTPLWRVEAGAAPTRYKVTRDIRIERSAGTTLLAESFESRTGGGFAGLVITPNPDFRVRAACRQWLRPASLDTLVPIAIAGMPLDDQLVFAGGKLEQCRAQVEWSPGRHTFISAYAERSKTRNLVSNLDGVLNTRADVTNLERLRNRLLTPPPKPDLLEDVPVYAEGVAERGVLAIEQLLGRGFGARVHYIHTDSRNTDPIFPGRRIPYLARHQVNLGFTWSPGWHTQFAVFAVHRSPRFADEANNALLPASWDMQVNAFLESPGKRWAIELFAANLLKKEASDVFGLAVSYRF